MSFILRTNLHCQLDGGIAAKTSASHLILLGASLADGFLFLATSALLVASVDASFLESFCQGFLLGRRLGHQSFATLDRSSFKTAPLEIGFSGQPRSVQLGLESYSKGDAAHV